MYEYAVSFGGVPDAPRSVAWFLVTCRNLASSHHHRSWRGDVVNYDGTSYFI